MKNRIFTLGVMALLFAACSVNELDIATPDAKDAEELYATIEDVSTRVFVDDDLMVLWHADDRVSIFNKYTYNQQYRFTGQTGANSGSFTKVPNDDFVTGNALNNVYAIYPYKESTVISNQGVLTIDLPATQSYAENSFGIGANTMVSCSEGNELLFKNLCGYIMLKFYGDNVTVTSISIKGNNDEPLAGNATVNASVNNAPTMTFDASATKEITLTFDTPITLGTTAETATTFWLVVPPTTFSKGITLTVKDNKNGEFKKSTTSNLQISRNTLKRLTTLQIIPEPSDDAIVFADPNVKAKLVAAFDTNGDGEISYKEAATATSIEGVFGTEKTYTSFDEFQFFISINTIPDNCFSAWTKLESIILPSSIYVIGNNAFQSCSKLTSIIIPAWTVKIGDYAFAGCSRLQDIEFPESVTYLPKYVCSDCINLQSVHILGKVTIIGERAFAECNSLTSIELPSSLRYINDYAFNNCRSLSTIALPQSMNRIYQGAFCGCSSLESIVLPSGISQIEPWLLKDCTSLSSVSLPPSISLINSEAFCNCSSLISVTIPSGVTKIWFGAFKNCTNLSHVQLPNKLSVIGSWAFSNCAKLEEIQIPSTLLYIGVQSFSSCVSLKRISLPLGLQKIGQGAFKSCLSLSEIIVPDTVTSINFGANNESGVSEILGGTSSEDGGCFSSCSSLQRVVLSESLIGIPGYCFSNCTALKEIIIPESVTSIGRYAFSNCTSLITLIVQDGTSLIEVGAFSKCSNLADVSLGSNVTSLGEFAFLQCSSLSTISIPHNVRSIGQYAFYNCSGLTSIEVKPLSPPAGGYQMFLSTNNSPIFVPGESLEAYKSAQYWSDYADRIQSITSPSVHIPDAVDLGLPSGLKWASFNLGATAPEEYGDYYAWGETEPYYTSLDPLTWKEGKDTGYDWASYKWLYKWGDAPIFSKYNNILSSGAGVVEIDNKTVLDSEDDAAHAALGGKWRLPTITERLELKQQCTWTWTSVNGVDGYKVTATNGNSIFLPAAGRMCDLNPTTSTGSYGYYWLSTREEYDNTCTSAHSITFYKGSPGGSVEYRCHGLSIRPVCD